MNALEEFRTMNNPYLRDGEMKFAPTMDAIADRLEAEYTPNSEIAEKYMPYPLDADGVPCKLGDYVESGETCGNITEMLIFKRGRWEIYLTTLDDSVSADSLHHVKPNPETIDDVRNEITKDWDYAHDLINRAYECGKRDAE